MFVNLSGEIKVFSDTGFLAVNLYMRDCLLHGAVVTEIDFQGFLLGSLGGVCPVTFGRLLDAVHIRVLSTAYPHLLDPIKEKRENLLRIYEAHQKSCGRFVNFPEWY